MYPYIISPLPLKSEIFPRARIMEEDYDQFQPDEDPFDVGEYDGSLLEDDWAAAMQDEGERLATALSTVWCSGESVLLAFHLVVIPDRR